MAKNGLEISSIQPVLKETKATCGWSLCIGAGVSSNLVPDWITLVDRLIGKNCDEKEQIDITTFQSMGFSADAMIQAVRNRLDIGDEEFIQKLSDEIYTPIREKVSEKEWAAFVNIHEASALDKISEKEWKAFKKVIDKALCDMSANNLARVVAEAIRNDLGPKTILTFNGEAILLALLNYYYWTGERAGNKNKFDRVVNSITSRYADRIPYIHCHGVLPIKGTKLRKGRKATDKLVFLEESYLQLANSPLSWQAMSFIENCMQSKMVFVGVSLTDANMRRWLGWIHKNKMEELSLNECGSKDSTEHFWIKRRPKTDTERIWTEESVAHLGVRLIWIDEWNQSEEVLRKMLGL